jgi:hypothetical protein
MAPAWAPVARIVLIQVNDGAHRLLTCVNAAPRPRA